MLNITSGNINNGVLYIVYGAQSVIYNGSTYTSGQTFRGILSIVNFTFSGMGTQLVYELAEVQGAIISYDENGIDATLFSDTTKATGFNAEFLQNFNDIFFEDTTILNGFAIEITDYPLYSFAITEIRL